MRRSLIVLLILFCGLTAMNAQQPYAGCWHPDFIKDWRPEKDPDRKFNRSSVPLQQRISTGKTQKAHAQQFADGQVAACLTMHPMCSQVPAQGANNFIGYNPTYWQYLDLLIWWGGSAGEGIILPPSAPVIDAAHLNGTRVLGQIFFPTTTHSGLPAWTAQMNTKNSDGTFPYARKCVEIAKYYGFDGWFLNSETVTGTNWGEWVADYLAYAAQQGLTGQEIQVYVMNSGTSGAYIEDVARQKGGSYMVNYYGISTDRVNTRMNSHVSNSWGDRADAFRTWYYGIEQSGSITGNGSDFKTLFPTGGHIGSINIFNPEESIWKKTVEKLLNTPNASGTQAYAAMNTVFSNESKFWVNSSADVSSTNRGSANTMPGLATAIQERSVVLSKPFVTTFSAGLGKHRFVNGEKRGTQDWYHRGMQTVLPTWRWWQTEGLAKAASVFKFDYNWDDAYNAGTSINISGNPADNTEYCIRLYKTEIAVASGDVIRLIYKTSRAGSVKVKIADSANALNLQDLGAATSATDHGWTVDTYDLSSFAGKTMATIALGINAGSSGSGYTAQLGQLGVYPAAYSPAAAQVSNLTVENTLGETVGDLRVVWDRPASSDIHHFNVYLERNGAKTLAGQTRGEGFYIPKFARNGQTERTVKVSVAAVDKNMKETAAATVKEVSFPDIKAPEVSLKASKTLVTAGEEITVIARATNFPETYTWKAAPGAVLVRSGKDTAVYKFEREGRFPISVDVKNAIATTSCVADGMINVSSDTLSIASRKSAGGKIKDVSGYMTASKESPEWLIDNTTIPGGLSEKWCTGGSKEHWVILELGKPREIYRFQIYDCGHKENASDNLTSYRIYTSMTGNDSDWTLALDEKEVPANAAHNTKDDYIKPVRGRFVKFVPYNPDMASTIRLWQFDVWGLELPPPAIESISVSKPLIKPNTPVKFTVKATEDPTSYNWTINGGTQVSKDSNTVVCTFADPGIYDVTVTASNGSGTSAPMTKKAILEVSKVKSDDWHPLTVSSGFSSDFIAESKPAKNFASTVNSQGWAFYTAGADAGGALPLDAQRMLTSAKGVDFRFAPYDANNALKVATFPAENEITFAEQYAMDSLAILGTSVGGFSMMYATLKYADNTQSSMNMIRYENDWYGDPAGTAIGRIGRIKLTADTTYQADETDIQCRMFEKVLTTDPSKILKSVTVSRMGTGASILFAASARRKIELMTLGQPADTIMNKGDNKTLTIPFTLNMTKESDFKITVASADNTVAGISGVNVDATAGKVSFTVGGLKDGTSVVKVTILNGGVDLSRTFKVTVGNTSGIASVALPAAKAWPNPVAAGEKITVEVAGNSIIRLLTLTGAPVIEQHASTLRTQISTAGLRPGTYLLEIRGETASVSKLIIK
jgi:endo-beta-N-acetylglucosaminidase D/PKD repeat protein